MLIFSDRENTENAHPSSSRSSVMKNCIHLALIVMAIGWSCAEKSTISEVASTPSPVLNSYVVNGNSKARLAWEIPLSNPPQQFAIYGYTIALFSF
jgi:hypothetical protein